MNQTFGFGKNWKQYSKWIDDERVNEAIRSLKGMLGRESLQGQSFLDIGCGSGLFSLAAIKLGAKKVVSFDYDQDSVDCAKALKERLEVGATHWEIHQGSVLDEGFVNSLGRWDVVYSWGVLHHTGNMNLALEHAGKAVIEGGVLYISIYNDQGWKSRFWRRIKRCYNLSVLLRMPILMAFVPLLFLKAVTSAAINGRNPFRVFSSYKKSRGMSRFYDWIDWLGGYPFEVAKPEEIFRYYQSRGFQMANLSTSSGGCNEFVFVRQQASFCSVPS